MLGTIEEDIEYHIKDIQELSKDNNIQQSGQLAKQGRTHTSRDHDFETTIHGEIQHCILAAIVSNV